MFRWKELGAVWPSEQTYQVLEVLKQNRIRCRMPADDMFFYSPFYLPRADRRWAIQVRRRDVKRAMALLAREGLARDLTGDGRGAGEYPSRGFLEAVRSALRESVRRLGRALPVYHGSACGPASAPLQYRK